MARARSKGMPHAAVPRAQSRSGDSLERAVVGALRATIRDHGPITAQHIGSATKRVLGNLRNASVQSELEPDECRVITLPALACCCARCGHAWIVCAATADVPGHPDRCPQCGARTWDQKEPRRRGRPRSPGRALVEAHVDESHDDGAATFVGGYSRRPPSRPQPQPANPLLARGIAPAKAPGKRK